MKRYKQGDRINTEEFGCGTVVNESCVKGAYMVLWDKTPDVCYNMGTNPCMWLPWTFRNIARKGDELKEVSDVE